VIVSRRIRIELEGVQAAAVVHDEAAPVTSRRLFEVLPIEGTLRHMRWSGEAAYILERRLAGPTGKIENPISIYPPGTIAFRPEHGEFAFSYGQAQARDLAHIGTWACHLATVVSNREQFLEALRSTGPRGGKPIRIVEEAGS
jgi:hypothetical protein